ncbi:receptor-type tyrosine-protein phosphatase gamma-like [Tachysurus ichikawai]
MLVLYRAVLFSFLILKNVLENPVRRKDQLFVSDQPLQHRVAGTMRRCGTSPGKDLPPPCRKKWLAKRRTWSMELSQFITVPIWLSHHHLSAILSTMRRPPAPGSLKPLSIPAPSVLRPGPPWQLHEGLLVLHLIPQCQWSQFMVDSSSYITDLPHALSYTAIKVTIDRFSVAYKIVPLWALPTTMEMIKLLFDQVFHKYILSEDIVYCRIGDPSLPHGYGGHSVKI